MTRPCLVGRRSSVFTRLPLLFAETLGVACDFVPIGDMTRTDPQLYAGNPALKLPILKFEDDEPVDTPGKVGRGDRKRWELTPASSEDFRERQREGEGEEGPDAEAEETDEDERPAGAA